jgi:hypothetical protein
MQSPGKTLHGSRGMVLMSCLTILAVMLAVGLGTRVMVKNDYQALGNLRVGTEAFYYSAAGIEWSKNEVARATTFPPNPANQTKTFGGGSFSVSFSSSAVSGPLTARIVARSMGAAGTSSQTIQALLRKNYDLADGALVLRGAAARINLNGSGLFISGADHDPANGNIVNASKTRSAVSLSDSALYDLVTGAFGIPPQIGLIDPAGSDPPIALSDYLSRSAIAQLANDLCAAAGATVHGLNGATTLVFDNQSWGTSGAPAIHCIEGNTAAGDSVSFTGASTGAGILIVKSADLILNGAFRWEGLVIVSGQEVGLKALGSSGKDVFGAVLVNETAVPGSTTAIFEVQGNLRLLFSRQALNRAASLVPNASLNSLYSVLPAFVVQDYWRSVRP